jgi:hypothetical protein
LYLGADFSWLQRETLVTSNDSSAGAGRRPAAEWPRYLSLSAEPGAITAMEVDAAGEPIPVDRGPATPVGSVGIIGPVPRELNEWQVVPLAEGRVEKAIDSDEVELTISRSGETNEARALQLDHVLCPQLHRENPPRADARMLFAGRLLAARHLSLDQGQAHRDVAAAR